MQRAIRATVVVAMPTDQMAISRVPQLFSVTARLQPDWMLGRRFLIISHVVGSDRVSSKMRARGLAVVASWSMGISLLYFD